VQRVEYDPLKPTPGDTERFLDSLPGVLLCDALGRISGSNLLARQILGRETVDGEGADDLLSAGSSSASDGPVALLLSSSSSVHAQRIPLTPPDGTPRIVMVNAARMNSDTSAGVVLTMSDVTAGAEEEELLRTSEREAWNVNSEAQSSRARAERLQQLSAALSIASTRPEVAAAVVAQATAAFGAAGTVIAQLNESGSHIEILGVSNMPGHVLEEWRQFPVDTPVPLADATRSGTAIFLESREEWLEKYPAMKQVVESTSHHANIIVPLVVEGCPTGALGIAFETPRSFGDDERALAQAIAQQSAVALARARLFEKEREARARADEANRVKTEFLTKMSHELRTPLNAITGYTDLIAMGVHGPVTPAQTDALDRIRRSGQRLLSLINDVLNFARVDAGNVHLDLREVSLTQVLADVEPIIATQMAAKQLGYTCCVDETLLVRADSEKLAQILVNLLSNAVKFTPAGGAVVVEATQRGDEVVVSVRDTGMGVPSEKIERIFEPFVQLDRKLTSPHEGTGLGLAISRELARLMDGDLTVSSLVGEGSTFSLTLPAPSAVAQ